MVVHVCNNLSISEVGQVCEFEASLVKGVSENKKRISNFFLLIVEQFCYWICHFIYSLVRPSLLLSLRIIKKKICS